MLVHSNAFLLLLLLLRTFANMCDCNFCLNAKLSNRPTECYHIEYQFACGVNMLRIINKKNHYIFGAER